MYALTDPARVFLAGDWHGNRDWAATCLRRAGERQCPVVLQLGDFGLWPGREEAWLDHLEQVATAAGVHVVWIDGNHEDHDSLDRWRSHAGPAGLVDMRPRVTWAPRGTRWEWSGRRFGALGGAISIDRFLRRQGVNWWPQESLSPADVDRLGTEPLDVLATHAAPTAAAIPYRRLPLPRAIIDDALENRRLLDLAVERTSPKLVVHGHYHLRVRARPPGYRIEGLAHDGAAGPDAWAVLRLSDLEIEAETGP